MSRAVDVGLVNFFVFNPTLSRKEGEEYKKLLYFYPSSENQDTQIRVIGLSEAIISFMETFTDSPCESLHTQKTKQFFHKPEKDFWFIMTVNIPTIEMQVDNKLKLEYLDDHVIDKTYQSILERSYNMFKLFNGSISHILSKGDVNGLKQRLDHFFNRYLSTLRMNHSDVLDIFNGIHYLPLDRNIFLKVQGFVERTEALTPEIRHSIVLYNYQLVWSGIELEDLRVLYSFLMTSLYPAMMEQEFQVTSISDNISSSSFLSAGKFILGPPNIYNESDMGQIPKIHLGQGTYECHLLVYKLYDAVVALLLDGDTSLSFNLFKKLDIHFHQCLESLANEFADHKIKRMSMLPSENNIKYVYFNKANVAQKSSIHTLDGIVLNVHPDVMRVISNLNVEINGSKISSEDCETIVKMANDCWILGKKTEQREIYVIVNQKNANLIEINEEVKKICSTHFCNIFFFD